MRVADHARSTATSASALQREQVDQRQDAPLREHREREQQQDRAPSRLMSWRERAALIAFTRPAAGGRACRCTASRNAVPRNSGTRKMRILALARLDQRERSAADGELDDQHRQRQQQRAAVACASAMPQGRNSARPMHE